VRLPRELTDDEVSAKCRELWADLEIWRAGQENGRTPYSIAWLIFRYKHDPHSPYHKLRGKTKKSYDYLCNKIEFELGPRIIAPRKGAHGITGEQVLGWYAGWEGPNGETPSAAKHTITMVRTLARYAVIIACPGAREFKDLLSTMEFPVAQPRTVAPTREEVKAIVDQAVKDGYLSIAIATQAQFDLVERRTHIIGYWEAGQWTSGWRWQDIDQRAWTIRYHQNKVGLMLREFDLNDTPRLLELLELVPKDQRVGPVIKCERRRGALGPWNERHYAEVFRGICRRAGVSDEIKSMDMRAGGGTEADLTPGVTDRMLQDAFGHKSAQTKEIYRRAKQRNAQNVVKLRQGRVNE